MLESPRPQRSKWGIGVMRDNTFDISPWLKWALGGVITLLMLTFKLQYDTWTTFARDLQVELRSQGSKLDDLGQSLQAFVLANTAEVAATRGQVRELQTAAATMTETQATLNRRVEALTVDVNELKFQLRAAKPR